MEIFRRHAQINILFEKQIYHNGSFSFGLLEFEIHRNTEFEQYMIWSHWKNELVDIGHLPVLKQNCSFSLYNLPGRIHRFYRKSMLYINGFSKSEQFDSIRLDSAYQLVESVVTHGKYEDNMHLFNSSGIVCYIGSKRFFMRTNFIRTNKLKLAQNPFNIPETVGA